MVQRNVDVDAFHPKQNANKVSQEGALVLVWKTIFERRRSQLAADSYSSYFKEKNLLKPALAHGELRLMGATTTPEYRRYIEKDGALERRFQPLTVVEPTVYETLDILAAVSPKYEEFHEVEYTYNALVAAAKLSN